MKYCNIVKGSFLSRPNRFIAKVIIDGREEIVHVKNTGRCRELLTTDASVYLERTNNPRRKTLYDLVAVEKGTKLINMDSQAPNKVFEEYLRSNAFIDSPEIIKPEYKWGNSRFDFFVKKEGREFLIEVKGVTLETYGECYFPDAPTQRGVKHIYELIAACDAGYEACIVFIAQMSDAKFVAPNDVTHPEFGKALRTAGEKGVKILAFNCEVSPETLEIKDAIPVKL